MSSRTNPSQPDSEQGGRSSELALVHPRTGEILDAIEHEPTERLADWQLAFKEAEKRLKAMRVEIEHELRHRYADEMERRGITFPSAKHFMAVGDVELRIEGGNESVWDAAELEGVLRELVDDGQITAGDYTDVIDRTPAVRRSAANALLDRLGGHAHAAVAACRSWRRKGPGTVRVERTTWPRELDQD